jgi:hypothetical protein
VAVAECLAKSGYRTLLIEKYRSLLLAELEQRYRELPKF